MQATCLPQFNNPSQLERERESTLNISPKTLLQLQPSKVPSSFSFTQQLQQQYNFIKRIILHNTLILPLSVLSVVYFAHNQSQVQRKGETQNTD